MRLINCRTYQLEEFVGFQFPEYVILSHTWGEQEVSFAEFTATDQAAARLKLGFRKIEFTCRQALIDHYSYAWVDTVCIDKSSSAELSEAINSMFKWYEYSSVCYAYLSDVTKDNFEQEFPISRWFRRGWTLQELIAPARVRFYDSAWHELGYKGDLADMIYTITRIDIQALLRVPCLRYGKGRDAGLGTFCVAKRMSWASQRETTRVEDMAYCLLGIFDVNIPLLYGEGEKAFIRLQHAIINGNDDDSILAWGLVSDNPRAEIAPYIVESVDVVAHPTSILAESPKDFTGCHDLTYSAESIIPIMVTSLGLQLEVPLVWISTPTHNGYGPGGPGGWVGLLSCRTTNPSQLLGIILVPAKSEDAYITRVMRVLVEGQSSTNVRTGTVLVGPRVVAKAVPTKINIVERNESFSVRNNFGYRQIIVNRSPSLQSLGYLITDGTLSSFRFYWPIVTTSGHWDPQAKVLTVSRCYNTYHLLIFTFKNHEADPDPNFTVLIRDENAIIRQGTSFSIQELRSFFDYLMEHGHGRSVGADWTTKRDDGRVLRIVVTMKCKTVHNWKSWSYSLMLSMLMSIKGYLEYILGIMILCT